MLQKRWKTTGEAGDRDGEILHMSTWVHFCQKKVGGHPKSAFPKIEAV